MSCAKPCMMKTINESLKRPIKCGVTCPQPNQKLVCQPQTKTKLKKLSQKKSQCEWYEHFSTYVVRDTIYCTIIISYKIIN